MLALVAAALAVNVFVYCENNRGAQVSGDSAAALRERKLDPEAFLAQALPLLDGQGISWTGYSTRLMTQSYL